MLLIKHALKCLKTKKFGPLFIYLEHCLIEGFIMIFLWHWLRLFSK